MITHNPTCPKSGQILGISVKISDGNAGQISKSAFGLIIKVVIRNLKRDGQKVVQLVRWSDCQGGHIPRFHCIFAGPEIFTFLLRLLECVKKSYSVNVT